MFGDNSVSNVIIYLFLPDFLWESTACIACCEDLPLLTRGHPLCEEDGLVLRVKLKTSYESVVCRKMA